MEGRLCKKAVQLYHKVCRIWRAVGGLFRINDQLSKESERLYRIADRLCREFGRPLEGIDFLSSLARRHQDNLEQKRAV